MDSIQSFRAFALTYALIVAGIDSGRCLAGEAGGRGVARAAT